MTVIAAVKFENTQRPYHFACEIEGLVRGEIVSVETDGKSSEAEFVGYTEPEMIGYTPKKKVLGKVNKTKTFSGVRSGRIIRSKQQREMEAAKLRTLLQESHPTMLSMREIADSMGWNPESTSNFIKNSMSLEPKIVQVYKGWYTSKL